MNLPRWFCNPFAASGCALRRNLLFLVLLMAAFSTSTALPAAEQAQVRFILQGLTVAGAAVQPLSATLNPASTGLGKPPVIVTVSGGRPPYTVTSSNPQGFNIQPAGPTTFSATRILNGTGTSQLAVTDSAGMTVSVAVRSALTGITISQPPPPQPAPQTAPPAPPASSAAHVRFVLSGLTVAGAAAQPLSATLNPVSTGLGRPPVIVTVSGGRPPYTVTSSNPQGYSIQPAGANTFSATRILNGTGTSQLTVTDSAGATVSVAVRSAITGFRIQ